MDIIELKKEQLKLAPKVVLRDSFTTLKMVGAAACHPFGSKLVAAVIVCEYPSWELKEKKTFVLDNPLSYRPEYEAYREMPAIIEAYNQLETEPDLLLTYGPGILHPRGLGIASHLGLALNKSTIGIASFLPFGKVEKGKIVVGGEVKGFEVRTKEHANPLYISPGNLISVGSVLHLIPQMIHYPHKLPEPLHIAQRIVKKKVMKLKEGASGSVISAENK